MERPPPRSASRTDLSGLRVLPPPTLSSRVKRELTPKRLSLAGATLALGLFAALLLDTHFPESIEASQDAEARRRAEEILESMVRASGTLERWRELGVMQARVEDDWHGMFSALSVWGRSAVVVDLLVRTMGTKHHVRMDLGDGLRWGYDGNPWIDGAESTGGERVRVERLSAALSQLLLLPFSAQIAGSNAELLSPGVISIRFRHLGTGQRTQEWRLYFDPSSSRITHVVLPLTVADPSPLTRCDVTGWTTVEGLTLPSGFRCAMANRLQIELHQLRVAALGFSAYSDGMFAAPGAAR